jgi:hypothetical protein
MLDEVSGERMGMKPDPVRDYVITNHASSEMKRRGISPKQVQKVLKNPGQRLTIRKGRDVLQPQVSEGDASSSGSSLTLTAARQKS